MEYLGLALLGLAVGCFGTLIGAGGGFILVPLLVLLYPHESTQTITSISLTVVFFNALSGSVSYLRQRKVDVRSALWFSCAAVPGSVAGALTTGFIPRAMFELVLGVVLVGASLLLLLAPRKTTGEHAPAEDAFGPRIKHHRVAGLSLAFAVGFVSSLLGIGGGIIHVPALVHALGFPVHVATATSHFVLAVTAGAGTVVHVAAGTFQHGLRRAAALAVGVVVGAQFGARWARHAPPVLILRGLAIALLLVGVRIIYHGANSFRV